MKPSDYGFPGKFRSYRPSQIEAVQFSLNSPKRFRALSMPVGSGKSLFAMTLARHYDKSAILTITNGLLDQYGNDFTGAGLVQIKGRTNYVCDVADNCKIGGHLRCTSQRAETCPYIQRYNEAKASDVLVTNYAYWLNVMNKGQGIGDFDCLILDECFPAGTLVDDKPIEKVQVGDFVNSYDENSCQFTRSRVYDVKKRKSGTACRLTFQDGTKLVCTPNHPVLTLSGWKKAAECFGSFVLCLKHEKDYRPTMGLRSLWERSSKNYESYLQSTKGRAGDVQFQLCGKHSYPISAHGKALSGDQQAPYCSQSYGKSCDSTESKNNFAIDRMEAPNTRWQREGADCSADGACSSIGMGNGSGSIDREAQSRLSDELQIGYCQSGANDRDRGGRNEPPVFRTSEAGCEEGRLPLWVGVDHVEIFQQGCDAEFEELFGDGTVYNLEVENTHTYIAEGKVVHNCHDAAKALSSYLDFSISESEVDRFQLFSPRQNKEDLDLWGKWAVRVEAQLKQHLATSRSPQHRAMEQERMEQLSDKLGRLQQLSAANWVCEFVEEARYGRFWKFECVWPGQYGEMLFKGIPNVFLMSGSLRPSSLGELGIKRDKADYRAWPKVFPANRSPFYHVKAVPVKYGMNDDQLKKWMEKIDEIIGSRYHSRKGIIHTVSYSRQKYILEHSKFARFMLANSNAADSPAASDVVERFRKSDCPSILVSPSFGTGWDFPGFDCEWQIITNIPFPPMQSKVMQRRKEIDPSYQARQAAKELGQALGRPMRYEKDRSETFIVDDRIGWFVKIAGKFLPEDFSYNAVLEVPPPGPRPEPPDHN